MREDKVDHRSRTSRPPSEATAESRRRIGRADRRRLDHNLDEWGWALIKRLLDPGLCVALRAMYFTEDLFRSRIVMARHDFGRGEYGYFAYPLPTVVTAIRKQSYLLLVATANRWNESLGCHIRYPATHGAFLTRCRNAGQRHPTPLMLRYAEGDYNCLHQDVYGEHVFPLQATVLLDEPDRDFSGGELVLTEQRPRMQSRAEVVPLRQGDAVIFAVRHRPVRGRRGAYHVAMRHGVSRVRTGRRYTLGIIFHDAE